MKLAQLQKKVADVLGVSSSQKILAFEIFIDKISEILLEDITIKVPRIGFFQLKTVSFKNGSRPLIFSPLSEDFLKDARQLYLTIEVKPKTKNTVEFDSNIFSIGVGKPLLPLSVEELPDSETSYAMLKKSIEERVKELLTESDQIPNFNIWDDYYKSPSKYEDETGEEYKKQLTELTSDLKFRQENAEEKKPEDLLERLDDSTAKKDEPEFSGSVLQNSVLDEIQNEISKPVDSKEIGFGEELISPDDDFSAVEKLKYDETQNEQITIAELLNDIPDKTNKTDDADDYVIGENTVPVKEALDKILADEKSRDKINEIDIPADELLPPENISAFDELHKLNDEVISSQELIGEIKNEPVDETAENLSMQEIPSEEIEEEKKSIFEELHQLNDEVISSQELYEEPPQLNDEAVPSTEIFEEPVEEVKTEIEKIIEEPVEVPSVAEEEIPPAIEQVSKWNEGEETDLADEAENKIENEDEKIEWNWGDELREEFGIPKVVGEDTKFEMVDETEESSGGLEITDDFLEDNSDSKDFFNQLEKTLERELNIEESSNRRFTNADKRSTIDRNNLKKVVLEFSGPPPKYEFVEDRSGGKEKRMAITLVDEDADNRYKKLSTSDKEFGEKYKDNYFKKMALIIFGSFIIVGSIVVFIILKGSSSKDVQNQSNAIQESQNNVLPDSSLLSASNQVTQPNKDTSANPYEINDFPRTAVSPVPIKDATDKQILETIKRESANLKASQKAKSTPAQQKTTSKVVNTNKTQNVTAETRVSDRIYFDGKNYNIQISSWPNRTRAEQELSRLQKLGSNPIIVEANLPQKGGMWYRIRLGPFKTQKEAEDILKKNIF
jgi:cell division protein FtsN